MFTYDELLFCIDALNGVICTPDTLSGNIWGWVPFAPKSLDVEPNVLLGKVASLPEEGLVDFHQRLVDFWEGQGTIPDIKSRMTQVGLDSYLG